MSHYLDHAATAPMWPEALEVMAGTISEGLGNPSGAHRMARAANRVIDEAREELASTLGADPGDLIFTGGGTEADNLAIFGVVESRGGIPVCSAVEHHAVLDPVTHLGGRLAPVTAEGVVDLDRLAEVLDDEVTVVSIMLVNNETGIRQPLDDVAEVVRRHAPNALLHTDAVQAFCWTDVAYAASQADLISISAHKFGGPQGVGVLVARSAAKLAPRTLGGGQERGRRSGTQNVAGIASMATAASMTVAERSNTVRTVGELRDRLADGLLETVPGVVESGIDPATNDRSKKVPSVCHICIEGIESEALLFLLERNEIMASAAASCSSGAAEPSHVLAAMGYPRDLAVGSLRLSLGRTSTTADVDAVLETLPPAVDRLRRMSRA